MLLGSGGDFLPMALRSISQLKSNIPKFAKAQLLIKKTLGLFPILYQQCLYAFLQSGKTHVEANKDDTTIKYGPEQGTTCLPLPP